MDKLEQKINQPRIGNYKLNMIGYGDPGSGKTTLGATANHHELMRKVFFLDLNGGMLSVAEENDMIQEIPKRAVPDGFPEVREWFWYLANEDHEYQTVVIDTFTDLQELNLQTIVGDKLNSKSRKGKKRKSIDDRWREDYGESTSQLTRLAKAFCGLDMHTIFLCHKRKDQDDQKREEVGPAVTPSLQTNLVGMVDICAYMYITKDDDGDLVHRALFQQYDKFIAKDRSPGKKLPVTMDNPTLPRILDTIIG